ncbi:MAG: DNA-3-methyladenine glycosylase [Aphanocapsa feldmannii 288cV]|nr:MAG: DNA-3-methyladenine glycosylase [Aphanocapsa feldmannii 288cV]
MPTMPLPELDQPLPPAFFARAAERVGPDLIGCLLVRRDAGGLLRWGAIVETEAYCQTEPACHGHRRRSAGNETLFGPPGHFYVYVSYGVHHCCNVVTDRNDWASGVLLRAVDLPFPDRATDAGNPSGKVPAEPLDPRQLERAAAGPGLLCRHFAIDRSHDRLAVSDTDRLWLGPRPSSLTRALAVGQLSLQRATRIGISRGQQIPWRWYLRQSRSVSRRSRGDTLPRRGHCWSATLLEP